MKSFEVKSIVNRKPVVRIISAESKEDAIRRARSLGFQVLSIKAVKAGGRFDKMSVNDRQIFFQRLSSMLVAKVGTSAALEIIATSFTGTVRDAARLVNDQIITGADLHEAMAGAGPKYFPETIVAIVRTGSKAGDLAYALREAARFENELEGVKKDSNKGVWSAVFGFLIGLGTILASTMYVAPMIMESSLVKNTPGVDIGWVMSMAHITTIISLIIAALIGLLVLFGAVLRPLAPALVDRGIMRIPFYRDMALAKSNYMVFFGLGVLLKSGLRVEEALTLTRASAPAGELRNDLDRALKAIVKGSSEPWAYQMHLLHPTDKAALATAQDRTQTAQTIQDLALQYQSIYKARLATFVPVMQGMSALLLSIAGFVLFAVSTIPLLQAMSGIMAML